jgi:hypothetical protein
VEEVPEAVGAGFWRIGVDVFVDRWMMSFPWTTRLSLDFFRSRVKVSVGTWGTISISNGCWKGSLLRTIPSKFKVEHVGDFEIDNAEKPLVLALKLLLVENLNRYDRTLVDVSLNRKRERQ